MDVCMKIWRFLLMMRCVILGDSIRLTHSVHSASQILMEFVPLSSRDVLYRPLRRREQKRTIQKLRQAFYDAEMRMQNANWFWCNFKFSCTSSIYSTVCTSMYRRNLHDWDLPVPVEYSVCTSWDEAGRVKENTNWFWCNSATVYVYFNLL